MCVCIQQVCVQGRHSWHKSYLMMRRLKAKAADVMMQHKDVCFIIIYYLCLIDEHHMCPRATHLFISIGRLQNSEWFIYAASVSNINTQHVQVWQH